MTPQANRNIDRGPAAGLIVVALLAAGAAMAVDDLDWEAADGSFPDHGGCTYFGPREGVDAVQTAADDYSAMKIRTWDTRRVLAMIPQPRRGGIPVRAAESDTSTTSGACSGIDDCIQKTADAANVPLTYVTTDTEFLRRVRLDLTGRIPTREEVLAFLGDASANKRERLIDELLETSEWADRWAMFFGDLFRNTISTAQVNRYQFGRDSLHLFLLESMRQNKPYDQMAREMISAEGTSDGRTYPVRYTDYEHFRRTYLNHVDNPVRASAAGYVVGGRTIGGPIQDTYDTLAFITARDFLGISLMDCVLCHDGQGHLDALSVWGTNAKRLDGWRLAAFFSDIPRYQAWRYPGRQLPNDPRTGRRVNANYYFIHDLQPGTSVSRGGDTAGEYLAQTVGGNRPDRVHSERFVTPSYPFGGSATVDSSMRLRQQAGLHLTADPQFARAAVNYMWRQLFSRGIVEPPDQFDLARLDPGSPPPAGWEIQPSHPHLLEWLADGFRESGFDLKWLMREIATSQTYQLSSRYDGVFSPLYDKYFVRHQVKRLTAEQLHDALAVASGRYTAYSVSRTFMGVQYAMQFPDVTGLPQGQYGYGRYVRTLLQAFTPGDREETARSGEGSPLQALNLMNNPFVLSRIAVSAPTGTLAESLELADDALVANLYLSVLSRYPTDEETKVAVDYLEGGNRNSRAADLMWALFNKTDFYFNY